METKESITASDIESAQIVLSANCSALSAISNAIEVLTSLDSVPKELFDHTVSRLATHAIYLADSLQGEVGCFLDKVKATQ